MNILVLTEGGRNIGYGHMSRCIALAEAFCEMQRALSPTLKSVSCVGYLAVKQAVQKESGVLLLPLAARNMPSTLR